MKKYINVGFMAIFTLMTFVLSFSSCSSEDDDITSEYPPEEKPEVPHYDNLSYMPGANVQLINKAEYCKSIIADGKELITGNESGVITVPELKDPKIYITFKEGITDFSDVFFGCTKLTSVPANLFANHPNATSFSGAFLRCTALTAIPEDLFANNQAAENFAWLFYNCRKLESIPEKLFANCPAVTDFSSSFAACKRLVSIPSALFAHNPNVTDFSYAFSDCSFITSIPASLFDNNRKIEVFSGLFSNCTSLKGESPYTVVEGKKVHLYERELYPELFEEPGLHFGVFEYCTGLTDYANMPSVWQKFQD